MFPLMNGDGSHNSQLRAMCCTCMHLSLLLGSNHGKKMDRLLYVFSETLIPIHFTIQMILKVNDLAMKSNCYFWVQTRYDASSKIFSQPKGPCIWKGRPHTWVEWHTHTQGLELNPGHPGERKFKRNLCQLKKGYLQA